MATQRYHKKGEAKNTVTKVVSTVATKDYHPIKIILENLEMGSSYQYNFEIDGKAVSSTEFSFETKNLWEWRMPAPDFTFMVGSCIYINDSIYDRPVANGKKPYGMSASIMETMGNTKADFMIWLGDNHYYREADFSSVAGMKYRFSHDRKIPETQKLLRAMPNYAIWDDHDFGSNDSHRGYEYRDSSLSLFSRYWANNFAGSKDCPGVQSKFSYSDAEFYLMDDRYYRSSEKLIGDDQAYWGTCQMNWLKDNLISSRATFKIICNGNQVLNPNIQVGECMHEYQKEYTELMNFITQNKIEGVIFITGDRHFSELVKVTPRGGYSIIDYTSSPLTSSPYIPNGNEAKNNDRVEGSLQTVQNFGLISIYGKRNERILKISTRDAQGKELFTYEVNEKELKMGK